MRLFHLTKRAVSYLADIWEYTSEHWSEKQAEKSYMLLINSCQEIAKEPRLGKCYYEISKDIVGFKAYQHVIFYRIVSSKEIEVVRILHGRMDLKNKL